VRSPWPWVWRLQVLRSPAGAGGTYQVVQCHPDNRSRGDLEIHEPRAYGITTACDDAAMDHAIQINTRLNATKGREGSVRWIAPEATAFVRVRTEAKLRRAQGHHARVFMADAAGRETHRLGTGDGSPSPFKVVTWDGPRQEQFVATLGCERAEGCEVTSEAKTWIRDVKMTLVDTEDPEVAAGGSLLAPGWKRGSEDVTVMGDDVGSGLSRVIVHVNGTELTHAAGECPGVIAGSGAASRLRPCVSEALTSLAVHTTDSPFHNGRNAASICGFDFAGNPTCDERDVLVDNAVPNLAFTSAQDPNDPELIHAVVTDPHSGVADGQIFYRAEGSPTWQPLETRLIGGELQARVDSTTVPAGIYEFRALATDVAGNQVETTRRQDGLSMRLGFPLKAGVDLTAGLEPGGAERLTVRYGRKSRVSGVLREAGGGRIPGQEIVVEEFFGQGALIRERISRVTTDARGRWQSRLPAGPSRRVTASYAGTQRYLSTETLGGKLAVRTKASLRTSKSKVPEGGKVVFRGRLGRLGARIPAGGKLLELQVKQDRNTYQTVGQGFRSKASGRYRVPYRFGRFYQYDVRFRFRVKVAREADWPYKAPVRSRVRAVTVLDR